MYKEFERKEEMQDEERSGGECKRSVGSNTEKCKELKEYVMVREKKETERI